MKINDDQLFRWTKPWFNNQEERAEKTSNTVKRAVETHLSDLDLRVFAKGSYPNNTNVRGDSDIDIAVELQSMINLDYEGGADFSSTNLSSYTGITEREFKIRLQKALEIEFGKKSVDASGNKIFRIRGSAKILDADVIPCTSYRYYYAKGKYSYIQGIELILNKPDGRRHINYPDQHLKEGVSKNTATMKRYKSVVRILKNVNNYMVENNGTRLFRSYMIECLAYNIGNTIYTGNNSWREIIGNGCKEVWSYLLKDEYSLPENGRWREANGHKFLFHAAQNWNKVDAKEYVKEVYNLLAN